MKSFKETAKAKKVKQKKTEDSEGSETPATGRSNGGSLPTFEDNDIDGALLSGRNAAERKYSKKTSIVSNNT